MAKDYVFTPPPNWPPPPRGWVPPPGWTPDPEWGPAPEGWEFWTPAGSVGSWFGRHTVLTGIGATVAVLGAVIGISAFASGSDSPTPVAAATSPTLLTAVDPGTDLPTPLEETLATTVTEPPSTEPTSSTTTRTSSPTTSTSTRTRTSTRPPAPTTTAGVVRYPSCRALRQDYSHGVGVPGARDVPQPGRQPVDNFDVDEPVYRANQILDRDGDGIACER